MRIGRVVASSTALAVALATFGLLAAAPARAAAYRYWTYWQGDASGWTFATAGPGARVPADGAVEGWRFAVTTRAGHSGDAPGTVPDFAAICGATPPVDGRKRVALVVDPGPASIAPAGQAPPAPIVTCVVAPEDATGYQVLRSAATVRTQDGLICGIAEYPTGECAPVVDDPPAASATAATADVAAAAATSMPANEEAGAGTGAGRPWATIAVAVLLIAVATLAAVRHRRRNGGEVGG